MSIFSKLCIISHTVFILYLLEGMELEAPSLVQIIDQTFGNVSTLDTNTFKKLKKALLLHPYYAGPDIRTICYFNEHGIGQAHEFQYRAAAALYSKLIMRYYYGNRAWNDLSADEKNGITNICFESIMYGFDGIVQLLVDFGVEISFKRWARWANLAYDNFNEIAQNEIQRHSALRTHYINAVKVSCAAICNFSYAPVYTHMLSVKKCTPQLSAYLLLHGFALKPFNMMRWCNDVKNHWQHFIEEHQRNLYKRKNSTHLYSVRNRMHQEKDLRIWHGIAKHVLSLHKDPRSYFSFLPCELMKEINNFRYGVDTCVTEHSKSEVASKKQRLEQLIF